MKECTICSSPSSKYKCAKCRVPYCCVKCYSVHKEVCCAGEGQELRKSEESTTVAKDSRSEAIIPIEHLHALDKDADIQALLRSKRLAEHILMIDDAGDRPLALKRLRDSHPEFNGFVTSVLRIVNESTLHAVTRKSKQIQAVKEELHALVQADLEAQDDAIEDIDDGDDEGDFEEDQNEDDSDLDEDAADGGVDVTQE